MAATKRPKIRGQYQEEIRARIKVAQLINFLESAALAGVDTGGQEINPVRIQAARILLDKTISNAPTDINASVNGNLTVQVVRFGDDPAT